MHKKYTAVVLGCGKVGATFEMDSGLIKPASHAAALVANPRTELIALVDADPAALKRAGDYYKVATYTDARACLEKLKPDIVVIATPPATHEEVFLLALELNIPAIVCEKPVSDNLESAERMMARAKGTKSIIVVNHQRRFFPLFREARDKIRAGALGRIQQASVYYSNGLLNNGTHTIDTLQFLLDDIPAWAIGVENSLNTTAPFGTNIDGMLGFKKGTIVTLQSLDNSGYGAHDFVMYGTTGGMTVRQYGFHLELLEVKDGVTFEGMKELDWEGAQKKIERRSQLQGTAAHVVECLDGKTQSESTLEDGYRTMQALDALVQSAAEEGKRIII